ncbi:hypothetical protein MKQ68_15155 [Chitinophaga horti]|uniref:Uncharacterized protein n=1 Tax=Chitinophaga horti TaxID=2920382 RepID=A0ABY6IVM7_9BACT|nr:hypothetical protein [Chitinophaga horti]UYQ91430.1 hypothetical protein MKQ68_15155 [Chitinophaga horti]
MRYLFISENELLYDFADFLWNNGNSIYVQKCSDYDCVVMIQDGNVSFAGQAITALVFANDGIYTNAIPFPHKLFHIEQLDQRGLDRFLAWCKKFRLFGYNEP